MEDRNKKHKPTKINSRSCARKNKIKAQMGRNSRNAADEITINRTNTSLRNSLRNQILETENASFKSCMMKFLLHQQSTPYERL